jgi:hypothetical protein
MRWFTALAVVLLGVTVALTNVASLSRILRE